MMLASLIAFCLLCSTALAASPAAPTFQELMDPARFPDPQRGMEVEAATLQSGAVRLRTTGAEITAHLATGEIRFTQRLGHQRRLASLKLAQPMSGCRLTHSGRGFARVTIDRPRATIRVNGDSLFMLHVHQPLTVSVTRHIEPAWTGSFGSNHLVADEWGAFGLYCSESGLEDHFDAYRDTVATHDLPADAVLWVAVCPPKPYDWERSFRDNVVWHWSRDLGYPPDEVLRSWKPHGNIVLLQSAVMLWKDWNLDFVPRLGAGEFARVRRTIHDLGMRFIVYTSPHYFLKGTDLEGRVMNSFEGLTDYPPGTGTGENMGLFLEAITRLVREHKPDGLYFDGQYTGNPAALYALARRTRQLLGEDGILEWHSTTALGSEHCYLPQADAYVDFILRGEGGQGQYADFDYLRFFVSGYSVHNSIGVLCNNMGGKPTADLVRDVLCANARFHTFASRVGNAEIRGVMAREYHAKLAPELRAVVDQAAAERQAEVAEKAASVRAEREALRRPPDWGEPVASQEFASMPEAERVVSPQNDQPFSIVEGALKTRGLAHTYAYLKMPLQAEASGLLLKVRHGTDGGMSWGPSAMLRWKSGGTLRIGTRSDGTIQANIGGRALFGSVLDPEKWVWLRSRWGRRTGIVECSRDGVDFERVWTFEHGGALSGPVAELLIGKVPFNGLPQDFSTAGDAGESAVDFVRVYGK